MSGVIVRTYATITTKGQVTIPKEIRDYLNLDTGSKVDFVIDENGIVKLIPLNVPIQSLSGILHRPGIKSASLQMETAIKQGAMGRVY
ncbi:MULTISPECIES: AbrB/MazE/SpoVT family DNA-binding domain-containing protein [Cyanophyceae]|uniref:AbrB family transcriptional regulator n=1 Tax=Nodularia spumigena CENA596 TaxID=1819295 RepID=A0A161XQV1_NODSP|nr:MULTISPECIES: AbrB/MazE/SpoVT family DNA-binding domain-containing protein [Cyanophyceae]MDB9357534.1 AbrB/MazE/SpoVT family DNA-binding domain-containing protein [Nodularia spumigena CS-587/03]KZL51424.1 AbrB family transcriptional regulator [Nodularia spumigena CENA596]MDB9305610.1 AbrB/MazE/SpoVT family DNA-binding domain-containing protein [Nodularia spumigena CS-591/12]MDB9319425.1 AbrB/MazE/SpoVT family DNA-binding domain-containing protein [Nodularia spumigena CS-590/01A]MDB9321217.1